MNYPTDASSYELLHQVGGGIYSDVYEAVCKTNGQHVCVKIINLEKFPKPPESILKQTALWSTCNSPYIVQYYGSFYVGANVWIVTEYMDAGSVEDIIKFGYKNGIRNESVCANILFDALKGLDYFHQHQQIHRNVKSCNILLNKKGEAKLADFGLATSLIQGGVKRETCFSMYGDACYMSPEVLENKEGYSEKSDIWSLGLTGIEIATGKMPFEGMKFMESIISIINNKKIDLPEQGFSPAFHDFILKCLEHSQSKRASSKELLNHKFFTTNQKNGLAATAKLLSELPPLPERFNALHVVETPVPDSNPKPETNFNFDFSHDDDDETYDQPVVSEKIQQGKIGRFNVTIKKVDSKSPDQSKKSKKLTELNNEIDTLNATISQLEKEHEALISRLGVVRAKINDHQTRKLI